MAGPADTLLLAELVVVVMAVGPGPVTVLAMRYAAGGNGCALLVLAAGGEEDRQNEYGDERFHDRCFNNLDFE